MDLYERIAELGSMGYHCSQMMMIMTLETIGEEKSTACKSSGWSWRRNRLLWRYMRMSDRRCLSIGYFLGNLAPEEKEDIQMKPAVQELYQWFREKTEEEFGVFYCKDITHLDWGVIMERCPALIAETYMKVMEILTERGIIEV